MNDSARRTFLLRKGAEVAKKLEDLLAHKEVDLSQGILGSAVPDHDDALRLRRFLELIDRRIKAARFGRCTVCEERLPEATLDETPWLERADIGLGCRIALSLRNALNLRGPSLAATNA